MHLESGGMLSQTLSAMHALKIPAGVEWELLVVNNNCTDDTDQVIESHCDSLPIHRLFEGKQGHSHARNCAVAAASGDLIVWTDDDVLVHEDWLSELARAAAAWPDATYFGGTIEPCYEVPPPTWIIENERLLQGAMLIRDLGNEERLLRDHEDVFGANMAFRQSALQESRFDPDFGRCGKGGKLGDETQLQRSLRERGQVGVWVPTARVCHYVPARRATMAYVWDYFVAHGRTLVRLTGRPEGRQLIGAPRWLYRRKWTLWLRSVVERILRRKTWLESYIRAAQAAGTILECRAQSTNDNQ